MPEQLSLFTNRSETALTRSNAQKKSTDVNNRGEFAHLLLSKLSQVESNESETMSGDVLDEARKALSDPQIQLANQQMQQLMKSHENAGKDLSASLSELKL